MFLLACGWLLLLLMVVFYTCVKTSGVNASAEEDLMSCRPAWQTPAVWLYRILEFNMLPSNSVSRVRREPLSEREGRFPHLSFVALDRSRGRGDSWLLQTDRDLCWLQRPTRGEQPLGHHGNQNPRPGLIQSISESQTNSCMAVNIRGEKASQEDDGAETEYLSDVMSIMTLNY